jgi:hypothetical protein
MEGINNSCHRNVCIGVMDGYIAGVYGSTNNSHGSGILGIGGTGVYGIGSSGYGGFLTNTGTQRSLVTGNGNVGIGTMNSRTNYKLDVAGAIHSSTGGVYYPDGSQQTTAWTGVVCGGDYAESVDVTDDRTHYEPGDVLILDPDNAGKILRSIESYSTSVSGIYSTKPGTAGRWQSTAKSPDEVRWLSLALYLSS